jgi:predicted acyltransferase
MTGKPERLLSLDALRGLTIAGMILVNNPGSWAHLYPPLRHARWHGCTPTDLVFPFFLFMVGVSMALSLGRRSAAGANKWLLLAHAIRRALVLFLLGLGMYGFPDWRLIGPFIAVIAGLQWHFREPPTALPASQTPHTPWTRWVGMPLVVAGMAWFAWDFGYFDDSGLRVPGVLQRIGACYLLAAPILIFAGFRGALVGGLALVTGYTLLTQFVSAPTGYTADVTGAEGLLHDWIDVRVLGGHLYRERPDPEGMLSTLPATATVLCGVLTGWWVRRGQDKPATAVGLFVAANGLVFLGWCMSGWIPLNKKLWTGSYVIFTAGLALHVLGMCYWLIDMRGWRRWAAPLLVFGSNAIVVFVASSLMAKLLYRWRVVDDGPSVSRWTYEHVFASWASPKSASLLYALTYVLLWLLVMIPLYRRRIFIKV